MLAAVLNRQVQVGPCAAFVDVGVRSVAESAPELTNAIDEAAVATELVRYMKSQLQELAGGGDHADLFLHISVQATNLYRKDAYRLEGASPRAMKEARAVFHVVAPLNTSATRSREVGIFLSTKGDYPLEYICRHRLSVTSCAWSMFVQQISQHISSAQLFEPELLSKKASAQVAWPFTFGDAEVTDNVHCLVNSRSRVRPDICFVTNHNSGVPGVVVGYMGREVVVQVVENMVQYVRVEESPACIQRKDIIAVLRGDALPTGDGFQTGNTVYVSEAVIDDAMRFWIAVKGFDAVAET